MARYVNAFYNFCFLIQDWIGGGKTKSRQILESFRSSDNLKAAAEEAYGRCGAAGVDLRSPLVQLMVSLAAMNRPTPVGVSSPFSTRRLA